MKRVMLITVLMLLMPLLLHAQPGDVNKVDGKGRKQGYWKKYSGDTLKYEGNFVNDKPEGTFKYYYPGGKIKAITEYSDSGKIAYTVSYYITGKKLSEGSYTDRKRNGVWKFYSANEVLTAQEEYIKGVKNGAWITFYEDGKKFELITWKNDKKNGPWIQYYPDTTMKMKANYADDRQEGPVEFYYMSGKLLISGTYTHGERSGVWTYFHENGAPERKITFDMGSAIKEEIVFLSGTALKSVDIYTIAYVVADENKARLTMNNGDIISTNKTMDEMERMLNEYYFFRINPQYIISNWSVANRSAYSDQVRKIELKPPATGVITVAADKAEGFLHWSGLVKAQE